MEQYFSDWQSAFDCRLTQHWWQHPAMCHPTPAPGSWASEQSGQWERPVTMDWTLAAVAALFLAVNLLPFPAGMGEAEAGRAVEMGTSAGEGDDPGDQPLGQQAHIQLKSFGCFGLLWADGRTGSDDATAAGNGRDWLEAMAGKGEEQVIGGCWVLAASRAGKVQIGRGLGKGGGNGRATVRADDGSGGGGTNARLDRRKTGLPCNAPFSRQHPGRGWNVALGAAMAEGSAGRGQGPDRPGGRRPSLCDRSTPLGNCWLTLCARWETAVGPSWIQLEDDNRRIGH